MNKSTPRKKVKTVDIVQAVGKLIKSKTDRDELIQELVKAHEAGCKLEELSWIDPRSQQQGFTL